MFGRIDIYLTLALGILGIIMYLIPKSPTVIICLLVVAFGLSFYIVWTFPWIKNSIGRRLGGLLFVAVCLCVLGYYVWPPAGQVSHSTKQQQITEQRKGEEIADKISKNISPKPKESPADVALKFVYPESPALVIVNLSDSVARDIKWTVILWNMDLPDRNDPLPIPIQKFDWIKGKDKSGPQDLFNGPVVSPLLKPGNRLFGSASIDCPSCARGRTYIVYIVWGHGGWFSEVKNERSGDLIVPPNFLKDSREKYFKALEDEIPKISRIPIEPPKPSIVNIR